MTNVVSKEAIPSLDYLSSAFRTPAYDARISETKFEYFYPISGTKNTTCLRWTIPPNNGNYVSNMEGLILALEPRITDREKQNPPALDINSGPINNFCNSIFSALRISFNTTCVLKMDHFPIYSYCRMLLNNNEFDFKTWADCQGFTLDVEEQDLDDVKNNTAWQNRRLMFGNVLKIPPKLPNGDANPAFKDNGKFRYSSEPSFFLFKLNTPLVNSPLLPGVTVTIELDLNKPSFVFQSIDSTDAQTNINFDLDRARLFVEQTKLNDKLYLQLEERLRKESMRQFFTTTMINTHSISSLSKTAIIDSIGIGYFPSRMYLAVQETQRANGDFTLNGLKFSRALNTKVAPFMIESVKVSLAGNEVEGLACDLANNSFRDHFFRLYHLTNQDQGKNSGTISFKKFTEDFCLFVYDFTSTLNATNEPLLPLVKKGHIRAEIEFDVPSKAALTVISMLEVQSVLTIENGGKVTISTL